MNNTVESITGSPSAKPRTRRKRTAESPSLANGSNIKSIISDVNKTRINLTCNGISSAFNLMTFINSNFISGGSTSEALEKVSGFFTKCSTAAQGIVNATIEVEKKNLFALVGAAMEVPIAIFASGFNLFLARGVAAGTNQFDGVISSLPRIKDGKEVFDKNGKRLYYDNFQDEGWIEGLKILFKKIPGLTKEIFTTPFEKKGLFPRFSYLCSSLMILGPLIFFTGLEKIGAAIRDFFGGMEAIALMTHKHNEESSEGMKSLVQSKNSKQSKFSNYFLSGVVWTIGAALDYLKRLSIISDKFSNVTELSLLFDRIGAIFYILGNQEGNKKLAHI